MGMGPIMWACLVLTSQQAPTQAFQEYFMPDRGFRIPIKIDEKRRNDIKSLILLVSPDRGVTWQQAEQKQPSEKGFIYRAPQDGPYWFIVQEVDRNDRTNPADPQRAKPSMAVIVDTAKPNVQVTAERMPSGDVRVRWNISEPYPDVHSLRLEYRTDANPTGEWTPIMPQLSLQGQHEFNPGAAGARGEVKVRVRIKDKAGNEGEGIAVVPAPTTAAGVPGSIEGPTFGVIPTVQAGQAAQSNLLASRQTPLPNPPTPENPGVLPARPAELNPVAPPPTGGGMPVAATPTNTGGTATPTGPLPPLKLVNKPEVRIDFRVEKVGPSGLGNAVVFVTRNEGAKWEQMPGELTPALEAGADLHSSTGVKGSVMVKLPAEKVIYGFIVQVKSKAGLAPPPPRDGEPPEFRVELDTTAPKAQLIKPAPDTNTPNTLILYWNAEDRNLVPDNAVTLDWAERKDGPWTPIGPGPLPNTGQYAWTLPLNIPSRVFLRLTVRDAAGNEARAQTDTPQLIDLSVPQTHIIVSPNAR